MAVITSAKDVVFSGLFVCQQDYRKTTDTIFMKLGGNAKHSLRTNPENFGVDLNHKADTPSLLLT